jgi:hypothetical protein
MTVNQLRRTLKQRINRLSEQRLRSAADFIGYLEESSDPVAVAMRQRIAQAESDVTRGLLTPAANLRRKY